MDTRNGCNENGEEYYGTKSTVKIIFERERSKNMGKGKTSKTEIIYYYVGNEPDDEDEE